MIIGARYSKPARKSDDDIDDSPFPMEINIELPLLNFNIPKILP